MEDTTCITWHKSSYSNGNGGACVEVADLPAGTAVRDSKNPTGAVLRFTTATWSAFTTAIQDGQFD